MQAYRYSECLYEWYRRCAIPGHQGDQRRDWERVGRTNAREPRVSDRDFHGTARNSWCRASCHLPSTDRLAAEDLSRAAHGAPWNCQPRSSQCGSPTLAGEHWPAWGKKPREPNPRQPRMSTSNVTITPRMNLPMSPPKCVLLQIVGVGR